MTIPTHEQERQAILKEYPLTYFIAAAALFIVLGIAIGAVLFGQNSPLADADNNYFSNVYLTIISTAFTVIVIDGLNRRRDEQRDLRQLQEQLVRDVRSTSNEVAKNAVHQLRERGWLIGEKSLLKDEALQGVNLHGANLDGANLSGANLLNAILLDAQLSGADLSRTNLLFGNLNRSHLRGTNLSEALLGIANLSDAHLSGANLCNARLGDADLSGVDLSNAHAKGTDFTDVKMNGASLRRAKLSCACLCGADMRNVDLMGADLFDADLLGAKAAATTCNEFTVLPDGTKWTPYTDMTRFTDPNHPNFWRSDNPTSPAYRGTVAAPTPTSGEQP